MNAIAPSNVLVAKIRKHPKRETMVDKLLAGKILAPVREDMAPAKVDGDGWSLPIDAKGPSLVNGYGKGVAKAGQVGKDWVRPGLSHPPEVLNAFRPANGRQFGADDDGIWMRFRAFVEGGSRRTTERRSAT